MGLAICIQGISNGFKYVAEISDWRDKLDNINSLGIHIAKHCICISPLSKVKGKITRISYTALRLLFQLIKKTFIPFSVNMNKYIRSSIMQKGNKYVFLLKRESCVSATPDYFFSIRFREKGTMTF